MSVRTIHLGVLLGLSVGLAACTGSASELPRRPPPLSVINQITGTHTDVEADSWCIDGLFGESCAAVDGPLIDVAGACADEFVVSPPDHFTPLPADTLTKLPEEMGRVWFVVVREGTVLVRAEGSGQWNSASWTFELMRPDSGC